MLIDRTLSHLKITHFVSVASVVITSVASVAFWSQVSQVLEKEYCHNFYVVPITTSEGHLKHLKQLIWKKRNGLTEFIHLFPLENPFKRYFWRGALTHILLGSVITP
jgi:hypothetical protein